MAAPLHRFLLYFRQMGTTGRYGIDWGLYGLEVVHEPRDQTVFCPLNVATPLLDGSGMMSHNRIRILWEGQSETRQGGHMTANQEEISQHRHKEEERNRTAPSNRLESKVEAKTKQ